MENVNNRPNNDNIQKILDNSDIVSVISNYIPLEKKGNDYKGLCPFHNDSNPSLSVSPSKKVFKCFSCNTAGNVIQFVQKYENISFVEAMKKVANISGIELNIRENPTALRNRKYHKIMDEVCGAYEFFLKNTNEGEKALEYLRRRNISDEIISHFRIGLSNHDGNLIVKTQVETNKILPIDLQELMIIGKNPNDNHYYDLFRGRIMFPLKDLQGNIIGFSGRIYDMDSNSKYMNSKENILFNKSNVLYNYSDAVNEIKKNNHVIIFEGFMDVIASYKAGVYNTLATMGTALTEDQIKIILKLTNNVTLCYDGDGPGIDATKRAIRLFSKYGVIVKTVMLEEGLDPDDYFNKYGKEKTYDLLVNKNVSSVDYLYNIEKRKLDIHDSTSITTFQKNIYDLVNYFKSNSLKKYLFDLMSKDLNLSVDDINSDFLNIGLNVKEKKKETVEFADDGAIDYPQVEYGYEDYPVDLVNVEFIEDNHNKKVVKVINKDKYRIAEDSLIKLAYNNFDDCATIRRKLGLDNFVDRINYHILSALYDYYNLNKTMNKDEFLSRLGKLEIDRINAIINSDLIVNREYMDDYIKAVKEAKYQKAANDCLEEINSGNASPEVYERYISSKKKTLKIKEGKK